MCVCVCDAQMLPTRPVLQAAESTEDVSKLAQQFVEAIKADRCEGHLLLMAVTLPAADPVHQKRHCLRAASVKSACVPAVLHMSGLVSHAVHLWHA